MKTPQEVLLEVGVKFAFKAAAHITVKAVKKHQINTYNKKNNIYVLKPKHFTPVN